MFKRLEQEEELKTFLAQNQKQVRLIKFSAEWCPPCHKLQENLEQLEKENPNLVILEVDVEKFPHLAQRAEFRISSLPTLLLFPPLAITGEKKMGFKTLP